MLPRRSEAFSAGVAICVSCLLYRYFTLFYLRCVWMLVTRTCFPMGEGGINLMLDWIWTVGTCDEMLYLRSSSIYVWCISEFISAVSLLKVLLLPCGCRKPAPRHAHLASTDRKCDWFCKFASPRSGLVLTVRC